MIGVAGPAESTRALADAIEADEVVTGDASTVAEAGPDVAIGLGEAAMAAFARVGLDVPVLPVEAGSALESVAAERAPALLAAGLADGFETRERPVLGVAIDGDPVGRGLFEAMLVTVEPARISEYAVRTPVGVDRYRADGVVVATPAGSAGYARAVGGPVLDPETSGLAVVPVAAFATDPVARVASASASLELRVERDEGDVSLLVDGDAVAEVPTGRPVTIRRVGTIETVLGHRG